MAEPACLSERTSAAGVRPSSGSERNFGPCCSQAVAEGSYSRLKPSAVEVGRRLGPSTVAVAGGCTESGQLKQAAAASEGKPKLAESELAVAEVSKSAPSAGAAVARFTLQELTRPE